jgi:hypothetical protein
VSLINTVAGAPYANRLLVPIIWPGLRKKAGQPVDPELAVDSLDS